MHVEIQVALNFFISFLYNKLPRRRVNQFGEELEKALKIKFEGHWYPEKPFKGSAFRCIKTAPPLDPVFEIAAHECGMSMADIQENLPEELSIWIDPGEVSYRLGEKGCVKILYSESESSEDRADREIYRTFNPEAQCFKPIDSVASQLGSMSISSSGSSSSSPYGNSPSPTYKSSTTSPINGFLAKSTAPLTFTTATFAQTKFGSTKLKTSGKRSHRMSPTEFSSYIKQRALIQQQQQLSHHHPHHPHHTPTSATAMYPNSAVVNSVPPQRPRSLSPTPSTSSVSGLAPQQQQQQPPPQQQQPQQQGSQQQMDANSFLLLASTASQHQQQQPSSQQYVPAPSQPHFSPQQTRPNSGVFESVNGYLSDIFTPSSAGLTSNNTSKVSQHHQLPVGNMASTNANALSIFFDNKAILNNGNASNASGINFNLAGDANSKVYGGMESINFNVGAMSYPNQHLLMAN